MSPMKPADPACANQVKEGIIYLTPKITVFIPVDQGFSKRGSFTRLQIAFPLMRAVCSIIRSLGSQCYEIILSVREARFVEHLFLIEMQTKNIVFYGIGRRKNTLKIVCLSR